MDGFTVKNANQFLQTGSFGNKIDQMSQSETKPLSGIGSSSEVSGDKSFADTLKAAINEVNDLQQTSNKKMQELAVGKTDNVADVMITSEKADIAMRVMVQVRNKVLDAYNEIMRMQV